MEPFEVPRYERKKPRRQRYNNEQQQQINNLFLLNAFEANEHFKKYFTARSKGDADLRKLNIFTVDKIIEREIGGEPKRVTEGTNGTLMIEVQTKEQSERVTKITKLIDEEVIIEPHQRYNQSEGVITCETLKDYSEEEIMEGLRERGVTKVTRLKKIINGELRNSNTLLLIFDNANLPEKIKIRSGLYEKVRPYIPRPRRCFKCQKYGHVGKYCRNRIAICVDCGLQSHNDSPCQRPPNCVNCGGAHPANNKTCDRFLLEKEILSIKVKEKLSFKEARVIAMAGYVRPGVSFATALKRGDLNNQRLTNDPINDEQDKIPDTPDYDNNNNIENDKHSQTSQGTLHTNSQNSKCSETQTSKSQTNKLNKSPLDSLQHEYGSPIRSRKRQSSISPDRTDSENRKYKKSIANNKPQTEPERRNSLPKLNEFRVQTGNKYDLLKHLDASTEKSLRSNSIKKTNEKQMKPTSNDPNSKNFSNTDSKTSNSSKMTNKTLDKQPTKYNLSYRK